jgi:hypothetical protein
MEPTEIREEVKEELEKEEKREKWINYLALTTVLLAVCATLSSFKLEHFSVDSVLKQAQASDQWAYYQAKSVKGYLYEVQKEKLELDLKTIEKNSPADLVAAYQKRIEAYGGEVKKYDGEKKDIMKEAKHLEKERDEAQERREIYGFHRSADEKEIHMACSVNRRRYWHRIFCQGLFSFLVTSMCPDVVNDVANRSRQRRSFCLTKGMRNRYPEKQGQQTFVPHIATVSWSYCGFGRKPVVASHARWHRITGQEC